MRISSLALFATAAVACSPRRDPDLALGYYPPAPCWQTFNPACQPFIAKGTEMTVNAKFRTAVVYGVSEYCAGQIVEELAREAAGRKNNGWVRDHGNLTFIEGGILVISGMSDDAVKRYEKLDYEKYP
ncbi:hypothetical protein QBC34DRAFT_401945 [Podospora aff. communis PSN243]|uniref:Uncharacterized protein n=1 Tax=Podospora aff. communis PSN243 TaxID=3040156 RepID=A0AAV9GRE6_9PEZI|nr:hypothetical protein QBC34DRAFT_401945 [Podospora aff. communis PSN243]